MQQAPHIEVRLLRDADSPPVPKAPPESYPLIVQFGRESFSCSPIGDSVTDDWTGTLSFFAPDVARLHLTEGAEFRYVMPPAYGMGRITRILVA